MEAYVAHRTQVPFNRKRAWLFAVPFTSEIVQFVTVSFSALITVGWVTGRASVM